ncbi:MAG: FIST signal transduction protein [Magnetovibrionaceae bacterium]
MTVTDILEAPAFKQAHARAEDWAHCAKLCVDQLLPLPKGANFGFVYLTDDLAEDLSSVLTYLRQKTGIDHWVGTLGMAIIGGGEEISEVRAVSAMVCRFPPGSFHLLPTLAEEDYELDVEVESWIAREQPTFAVVHGDPGNEISPYLIEEIAAHMGGFLVGGLTASRQATHQIAGRLTGGGVSGVMFTAGVQVACGLTQGCEPLAEPHVISDCLDNVIMGLDGRPALDVFKEDIGELLARDLNKVAGYIQAGLPIAGSDTGDYMVRSLVGIDTTRGWIAIGQDVNPGDRVLFARRDPSAAEADLAHMLKRLTARLDSKPKAALYISCVARGAEMFGEPGRELALLRQGLADVDAADIPITGFYAAGEISHNRLYGYTGVLTLFL